MKKNLIIGFISLFTATCFSQTFNTKRMDSLLHVLEEKGKFMGSIAVSQNGKLLYTNAIGYSDVEASKKATTQTKYRIGSISKTFTAVLILKAVEEKKLTLSKTLDHYFPQIENSKKITIENLLNHRSGIHSFTNDDDYLTYNTFPKTEKEMLELIVKGKSDFEPDSKAQYSNSNYVLLSYILEKIYKKDYALILKTKIAQPLGLKNTYFGGKTSIQNNESYSYNFEGYWKKETETDMSIPMGAGSLVSTPTDLTIFMEQLFTGRIISSQSLLLMKTFKDNYGLGLFEFPYYDKRGYGHTGGIDGFQSVASYFSEEKLAIALTSNGTVYPNNNVLLCALSCYFEKPFEIPTFTSIEVDAEILNSYQGQYASLQIPLKITITKAGNQLFAQATGQSSFPLEASSSTVFTFEEAGVVLEFNASKKEMILKQGGQEFLFAKE